MPNHKPSPPTPQAPLSPAERRNKTKAADPKTTMIEAALDYAARGWWVFPAPRNGRKQGSTSAARSNGHRWGCTTDSKLLTSYFTKNFPKANVGIALEESGLFVVEADTLAGHNVDGIASMKQLERKYGKLPKTLMSESPSGSVHRLFNAPKGVKISSSVSKIANGVDVIGAGGMVLVPPSIRPGKGVYRWLNDIEVADAPQWLVDMCVEKPKKSEASTQKQAEPELVAASIVWRTGRTHQSHRHWLPPSTPEKVGNGGDPSH